MSRPTSDHHAPNAKLRRRCRRWGRLFANRTVGRALIPRGESPRTLRNTSGLAGAFAIMVTIVGLFATAAPAMAISGLERTSGFSQGGTHPAKFAQAGCPVGKLAVGGGAYIYDGGRNQVRLTTLVPSTIRDGTQGVVAAAAQAPLLEDSYSWRIAAYAICADISALDRYTIVHGYSQYDDHRGFKTAAAGCPSGTVAYGAGASIDALYPGHVGLQLIRTSNPLDISRAAARDDGDLFGPWRLISYAICAEPAGAIHTEGEITPGTEATASCPSGYFVHGPGGGGSLSDGGPSWLNKIYPSGDLRTVSVRMTGPLHPSIGGMIAHMTCAA